MKLRKIAKIATAAIFLLSLECTQKGILSFSDLKCEYSTVAFIYNRSLIF
jgi:hypothetical protein